MPTEKDQCPEPGNPKPGTPPDILLTLRFRNNTNRPISAFPFTYGVPLPEGRLTCPEGICVRKPDGEPIPVQTRPLEHHFDGSIKWLLLDFALPVEPNEKGDLHLCAGASEPAPGGLSVAETPQAITVRTNTLTARIGKTLFALFESYVMSGQELMAAGSDIVVEDLQGKQYHASGCRELAVEVVERGAQRVVVQASGRHTAGDGSTLLDFRVRWTFRPDEPGVQLAYKFTNRETPETGVKVRSIRIVAPTALGRETTKVLRQSHHGPEWFARRVEIGENVELLAGGATNEAAKTRYGSAADGIVVIRNLESLKENLADYPYFLRPGNARTDMSGGLRQMYPYLSLHDGSRSAVAWFYDMGSNFPKALGADGNVLTFDIWPAWATDFLVRRGQSKEHDLYLSLADTVRSPDEAEGIYFDHEIMGIGIWGTGSIQPVELTLDPDYVRTCRVLQLHRWLKYDEDRYLPVEIKLGSACAKAPVEAQGMMDLGDRVSPDRSWSPYNDNEFILDGLREYYRREEPSMLVYALRKARHNAHVDFIACDPDPLRQGTMPAHCPEHTDGSTYPSHMWLDGLMAAYNLTGETDYRDAALSVGENMLRWQKMRPSIFYADSRECGWPMLAFLRLHEFTREQRWLDACEEIFQFYRERTGPDGTILYALPHGIGILLEGYGEFVAWRGLFFYWERTGRDDIKEFLMRVLPQGYKRHPRDLIAHAGWGANDLFPAWAAYQLTGEDRFIEDNYPFLRFLMRRQEKFMWGGIDMHPYLSELDRRGTLARFCE